MLWKLMAETLRVQDHSGGGRARHWIETNRSSDQLDSLCERGLHPLPAARGLELRLSGREPSGCPSRRREEWMRSPEDRHQSRRMPAISVAPAKRKLLSPSTGAEEDPATN